MENFHQVQPCSTSILDKRSSSRQVIGDQSHPVMTRQRLHTDFEYACMLYRQYQLTPKESFKEAMEINSWIGSMARIVESIERSLKFGNCSRPEGKNIIALICLWKNNFFLGLQFFNLPQCILISSVSIHNWNVKKTLVSDERVAHETPMEMKRLDWMLDLRKAFPTDQTRLIVV
ncbi:hypothetical protein Tco_0360077 [Tanacetum coccineum]